MSIVTLHVWPHDQIYLLSKFPYRISAGFQWKSCMDWRYMEHHQPLEKAYFLWFIGIAVDYNMRLYLYYATIFILRCEVVSFPCSSAASIWVYWDQEKIWEICVKETARIIKMYTLNTLATIIVHKVGLPGWNYWSWELDVHNIWSTI